MHARQKIYTHLHRRFIVKKIKRVIPISAISTTPKSPDSGPITPVKNPDDSPVTPGTSSSSSSEKSHFKFAESCESPVVPSKKPPASSRNYFFEDERSRSSSSSSSPSCSPIVAPEPITDENNDAPKPADDCAKARPDKAAKDGGDEHPIQIQQWLRQILAETETEPIIHEIGQFTKLPNTPLYREFPVET